MQILLRKQYYYLSIVILMIYVMRQKWHKSIVQNYDEIHLINDSILLLTAVCHKSFTACNTPMQRKLPPIWRSLKKRDIP